MKHALPFEVNEKGDITLRNSEQLREDGYRDMAKWMEQAEKIFLKKREDKSGRASLVEWTDYQGQLTVQNLKQRHIVLYNSVGKNVSAAHFDRHSRKLPLMVDQRTYWAAFSDSREAEYLVGILNSRTANQMIKPFQSMGLLGERDIHKKLLELPIPLFDANNPLHKKLADLSVDAGNEAARAVKAKEFPRKMLARQREYVRANIQPILKEIDVLVKQVFQATQDAMKAKP